MVDLDGTLIASDTLVEGALRLLRREPWHALQLPHWVLSGRARLKNEIARRIDLPMDTLPWRADLVGYLRAERAAGRRVILATAADHKVAQRVADHLGCFDEVIASDGQRNLKAGAKLEAILAKVGPSFVYAGDSAADLPIWQAATGAIPVALPARLLRQVTAPIERQFDGVTVGLGVWLRALRVHQFVKNLLVFVPLFVSFQFVDLAKLSSALLAFVAFCMAASATYVANDLWDLDSDRAHPRKRHRPFASGALPLVDGIAVAAVLLAGGLALAAAVSPAFLGMLIAYVVLTTAYSWALKQYVLMDVLCLASLYTWRVLAGSVAIGVAVSPWLLAFAVLLFGSLALVKRCAELVTLRGLGKPSSRGRDYGVEDLVILWPMGVGLGISAVVVFCLYVGSADAQNLHRMSEMLWLVALALLYWVGRLWIKTARGEMHDDPIVFTLRDRGSRVVFTAMVALSVLAHWGHWGG